MNEGWEGSSSITRTVFHFVGIFSAISCVMIAVNFMPDLLRGDTSSVVAFLEKYPGIEPFVIFTVPVIVIVGPVWIWKAFTTLKRKPADDA